MHGKNFRTLYYFIILFVITVLFVVVGLRLMAKEQKTETGSEGTETAQTEQSSDDEEVENQAGQNESDELSPDQTLYVSAVKDFENKNYQEAINKLNQAIAINPNNTSYYSLKSEAEYLVGKKEDAKATLEAGIKIDPNNELLNSKLDVLTKDYFQSSSFEATRE